jgi:hypothetical protein
MNFSVPLRNVPKKLLDRDKWTQICDLTASETEALCALNAPYPASGPEFFWRRDRPGADARRCYRLGRSMLEDCRARFIKCELVAVGYTRSGVHIRIPASWWSDLYPRFATDKVVGRTREFWKVERSLNEGCFAALHESVVGTQLA